MKQMNRDYSCENVGMVDKVKIAPVAWKDYKVVILTSSFTGQLPVSTLDSFDKSQKKKKSNLLPFFRYQSERI